ncbi:MAG: hypothetical protein L3J59_12410 [Methylococcaceae bacterium]|nr:hypothetical protein [Methylococcaceae bacterium]
MEKLFLSFIQIFTITIAVWSFSVQAESSTYWLNEREYTVTVSDNNKPILSVGIEYQGKAPKGNELIKHNWKAVDTDFYRETFKNLSGSSIGIKEVKYFLDHGQLHTPRIKGGKKIKMTYGTTLIKANELLFRNNAWVWAKRENILHRMFVFTYDNQEIEVDIPLVYF